MPQTQYFWSRILSPHGTSTRVPTWDLDSQRQGPMALLVEVPEDKILSFGRL